MEGLLDLGYTDIVRHAMATLETYQLYLGQSSSPSPSSISVCGHGAIPAYYDVNSFWVCSTGMAQLSIVWYRLDNIARGDAALRCLINLQDPQTGGFRGSYGNGAEYFPEQEISWAVKFALDALRARIAAHFDATSVDYAPTFSKGLQDGRINAIVNALGHILPIHEQRNQAPVSILDVGCGNGR